MRLRLAVPLCSLAASALGQAPPTLALRPGFAQEVVVRERSGPLALEGFAVGLRGEAIVAISGTVYSIDARGRRTVLQTLPAGHRVGILVRPPGHTTLWFTDFQAARLFGIDLFTGRRVQGPLPRNAFDLALGPSGEILVSANPGFPRSGAHTGVWHVDPTRGRSREVVKLRGPSGPLLFDGRLGLVYAEQSSTFPTPPKSVRLWAFAPADLRRALAGGRPLTLANARPLLRGLDGAYDLALDDRGRLCISDPQHGGILRTRRGATALEPVPLVARGSGPARLPTLELAFVAGGAATFDAYQPSDAGTLWVRTSDFLTGAEVRRIRPRRPVLTSSPTQVVPPGPLTLLVREAPPRAPAWMCISTAPLLPRERIVLLGAGGVPLWAGLSLRPPPACVPLSLDARGSGRLVAIHYGGLAANLAVQAFLLDVAHRPAAPVSTNPHSFFLKPK